MSAVRGLECQRAAFSLPEGRHYLNCAYMSPLPRVTEEAVVAGLRRKRDPSTIAPRDFFEDGERVRGLFARLVNGSAERVAIVPSAAYGIAIAARNLPFGSGQNVVITHEQFPGNVYAWRRLAGERGGEVRVVDPGGPEGGLGPTGRLLAAVDAGTAVVSVPHVHWTDGTRFDLEAVRGRCDEVGAALVVDGTQSVGALPFDVAQVRPDALVTACYKWLLGPYSTGLVHLGERFDDGVPLEETWWGREGSDDFQRLVDYRDAYQAGARRYDVGESSNFALLPGVLASLGLLLEWTPGRIQDYCAALVEELIEVARERGFAIRASDERGSHLFGIRMRADVSLDQLAARLEAAGISASLRADALRVSPHVYNDERDVGALIEVLSEV